MHAQYFKSVLPVPYRIFGLQLLPLSLGRYRLLKRFGCPLVAESEVAVDAGGISSSVWDLLLAVLICSMQVRDFCAFIESPERDAELARWGERIREEMANDPHFSVFSKFGLFRAYLDEGMEIPKYFEEEESRGSGAHWAHNLEATLRSELGYSNEEIEEGPLGKALFDYYKHAENLGMVRLATEEDFKQGDANGSRLLELLKGAPGCPV